MIPTTEGNYQQRKGEVILYTHDLTDALARRWDAGRVVGVGYRIRPNRATGYQYNATVAGSTGNTEPRWPTTNGGTVVDGTVTWTAEAVADNSLIGYCTGTGNSVWTTDGGATITAALPGSTRATGLIDTSSCVVGQTLRIVNRVTLSNSEVRDAVFNIEVVP